MLLTNNNSISVACARTVLRHGVMQAMNAWSVRVAARIALDGPVVNVCERRPSVDRISFHSISSVNEVGVLAPSEMVASLLLVYCFIVDFIHCSLVN